MSTTDGGRAGKLTPDAPAGSLGVILGAAALVIIAAAIKGAQGLIAPVMLALVLVVGVSPLGTVVRRRGWPSWAAGALTMIAAYSVVVVLFVGISVSVVKLAALLPTYADEAQKQVSEATDRLAQLGLPLDPTSSALSELDLGKLGGVLADLIGSLLGVLSNLFFLVTLLFFLAAEAGGLGGRVIALRPQRPVLVDALQRFASATRTYLLVSTVFGAIVAVIDGIALWLIGIPLPWLWAFLAFVTNYVPNIGFVVGLVPPAILGLLEGGWQMMLAVILVYCVVNLTLQTFIQPRVVGDAVGLGTTVTFLSLALWTYLLGPLGALLAVPMSLLAKALLVDRDPRATWVSDLLSSQGRKPEEPSSPVADEVPLQPDASPSAS